MKIKDLNPQDRQLIDAARDACRSAHAPYSGFRVGAAARLDDGRVLAASNQESEVLPSGMCAERILLYWIQSLDGPRIDTLAIAAERNGMPTTEAVCPCGACAQVLADTEKRQGAPIRVLMCGAVECAAVEGAEALLPYTFEL